MSYDDGNSQLILSLSLFVLHVFPLILEQNIVKIHKIKYVKSTIGKRRKNGNENEINENWSGKRRKCGRAKTFNHQINVPLSDVRSLLNVTFQ